MMSLSPPKKIGSLCVVGKGLFTRAVGMVVDVIEEHTLDCDYLYDILTAKGVNRYTSRDVHDYIDPLAMQQIINFHKSYFGS